MLVPGKGIDLSEKGLGIEASSELLIMTVTK
jgi:hypothetical protein